MESEFENRIVARVLDLNPRTLIDWSERSIVSPDLEDANGIGSRRKYSDLNLVELAIVKTLLGHGIKRDIVKAVVAFGRTRPKERQAFFSLSSHLEAEGDLYLIIDLDKPEWTLAFHRTKHELFSAAKAEQIDRANLAQLGERVRAARCASYTLNLGALKRQLRQKLE